MRTVGTSFHPWFIGATAYAVREIVLRHASLTSRSRGRRPAPAKGCPSDGDERWRGGLAEREPNFSGLFALFGKISSRTDVRYHSESDLESH